MMFGIMWGLVFAPASWALARKLGRGHPIWPIMGLFLGFIPIIILLILGKSDTADDDTELGQLPDLLTAFIRKKTQKTKTLKPKAPQAAPPITTDDHIYINDADDPELKKLAKLHKDGFLKDEGYKKAVTKHKARKARKHHYYNYDRND